MSDRLAMGSERTGARPSPLSALARELADGWLCFESVGSKRRLWPIPMGWDRLSDEELSELCSRAIAAPAARATREAEEIGRA